MIDSSFSTPHGADPSGSGAPVIPKGAQRKQNIACDQCRGKKIKCTRLAITERCEQCVNRSSECTSHYIEGLQDKTGKRAGPSTGTLKKRASIVDVNPNGEGGRIENKRSRQSSGSEGLGGGTSSFLSRPQSGESSKTASNSRKQLNLLRYLFAPQAVRHHELGYSDNMDIELCQKGAADMWEQQNGAVWEEEPSSAHSKLTDVQIQELADDILETWFSIAHTRFPMLDPANFRARFRDPDGHSEGPLHPAMIALCIAFGSRFSEHPTIADDRDEMMEHDGPGSRSRSRIVQLLTLRTREVAEATKIHRYPTLENIQVLILLEPLLGQAAYLKDKYQAYHIVTAVRHVCTLGYNTPTGLFKITNDAQRAQIVYAWWLICLSDGYRSAFNRLKPSLSDDEYDIQPPENPTRVMDPGADPNTVMWFSAAYAGGFMCRKLAQALYIPRNRSNGIPFSVIQDFIADNTTWRDTYLTQLGIPASFPTNWDFLAAITACGADVYYHSLWLVVYHSILEYGIKEMKDLEKIGQVDAPPEIEKTVKRIREEAEHGAFRIAALVAVLTENGYLRLDPLILYHPIYEAGLFLADNGKEECRACIAGLKQYSIAFGGMWDLAEEIERLFQLRTSTTMDSIPWSLNSSMLHTPRSPFSVTTTTTTNHLSAAPTPVVESEWKPQGSRAGVAVTGDGFTALNQNLSLTDNTDVAMALFDWLHQNGGQ